MSETVEIYVWPDKTWEFKNEIEDLDWYIMSNGKSDDFLSTEAPAELEVEEIEELIDLDALPGMLPDKPKGLENQGKIGIAKGAIIMVHHSEDIDYNAVTILKDKLIVNAPNLSIEVIKKE